MSLRAAIAADIRFRCRLKHGGKESLPGLMGAVFSRGVFVLACQRLAHESAARRGKGRSLSTLLLRVAASVGHKLVIVLAKSETPSLSAIAAPILLSDRGHHVLGAQSIGRGTLIHDRVTIGVGLGGGGRPTIGENVWIGRRCVIFGAIQIGDGATILPDSVVSKRVPPGAVVSGNPARVLKLDFNNELLRSSAEVVEPADIDKWLVSRTAA